MTGWFDGGRWACLDTESTGKDPAEARLVTACVALVGGGQEPEIRSWVADAGVEVPDEAAAVHGFTTERVRAEGKPIADVLPEIVEYLLAAEAAGYPFVIYNAPYDVTLLDREIRRELGADWATLLQPTVLDPLCIDKRVDRYRPGRRILEAACAHYKVDLGNAHDSTADALAAGRVLYRIGQRCRMTANQIRAEYAERRRPNVFVKVFADLAAMSLRELHDAQVGWYAEQASGLAAYWLSQAEQKRVDATSDNPPGDETLAPDERRQVLREEAAELRERAAGVTTDWPLRPLAVA